MYITYMYTLYVSTSVWLDVHIYMAGHNETSTSTTSEIGAPGYTLKLAGKRLNLSALLYDKKFRDYEYNSGGVAAFKELENAGLGTLEETKTRAGGTKVNNSKDYFVP